MVTIFILPSGNCKGIRHPGDPSSFIRIKGQSTEAMTRCVFQRPQLDPQHEPPGNGFDNAVAESFFSSLKKERIRRWIYRPGKRPGRTSSSTSKNKTPGEILRGTASAISLDGRPHEKGRENPALLVALVVQLLLLHSPAVPHQTQQAASQKK